MPAGRWRRVEGYYQPGLVADTRVFSRTWVSCLLVLRIHALKSARPDATDSVVRCEPGEDATNGFFVACFERADSKKRKAGDDDLEQGADTDNAGDHAQSPARKKRKKKKKKPVAATEVALIASSTTA